MRYNIIGRKVNLRDNFKERVYKKLGKFEKIFSDDAEAVVTVTVEKNRQTVEGADDGEELEDEDYVVVKTKTFSVKPLSVEEAILQMNMIGHEFFMFRNANSNEINVVYKRKNGTYGLLEPEV